jgi:hypothetical protein
MNQQKISTDFSSIYDRLSRCLLITPWIYFVKGFCQERWKIAVKSVKMSKVVNVLLLLSPTAPDVRKTNMNRLMQLQMPRGIPAKFLEQLVLALKRAHILHLLIPFFLEEKSWGNSGIKK